MFQTTTQRLLIGAPVASAVVFGLMTFMSSAVAAEFVVPDDRERVGLTPLLFPEDVIDEPHVDHKPAPQAEIVAPPDIPPLTGPQMEDPEIIVIAAPAPTDTLPSGDLGKMFRDSVVPIGERVATPIVNPQPVYPESRLRVGATAECDVRFSLTSGGIPFDVVADCTDAGFERSARRAVERARFAPEVRDGHQVETHGLVFPLMYNLASED